MNKQQLRALMSVDLRLANPQVTDRYRKKGKTGAALTKKLTNQFVYNTIIFILIYGFTMFMLDFSKMPGMFTFYVGLFVLLGISQSISSIYNVFFAGKDLASYLPLPFREKEIFFSKTLIVFLNVVPFTLPLLLLFFYTGWRFGIFIPLAIILAIVVFLLIMALVFLICALIVFGLTKTKLFQHHKNAVMSGLMAITMIIAVAGILLMNGSNNYAGAGASFDRAPITLLLPIYQIFKAPISLASGEGWLGLIALLSLFAALLKYQVLPNLSEQLTQVNTTEVNNANPHKKARRRQTKLVPILDAYNRQLLKEPNLLLQVLSSSIMMPLIFILTFAMNGSAFNFGQLPVKWFGVFFVGGLVFAAMTVNQTALIANLISLDRENFEFVRSLPISMKQYLHRKFQLGFFFQVMINILMLLIAAITFKMPLVLLASLIVGVIWGTYLMCLHYFRRDYRLRITNWTNITQLFNRGGGNLALVATMFGSIIIGGVIVAAYAVVVGTTKLALLANVIALSVVLIVSIWFWLRSQKKFWRLFD
ncbi:ABC transporter permease [Lapidilactobacillus wuchangensis]|uniref:ABC transporter permease n=1 Tax=Lapidilactobacillus wuchangensis TaxID=2486001 RepID=UPI000F7AAF98|nr:ABC transporter permease [Lapidilactobacillus wuchangensis]